MKGKENSVWIRARILTLLKIKGAKTISQISNEIKISRRNILNHLQQLEKRKLVERGKKQTHTKGQPVAYAATDKADLVPQQFFDMYAKTIKIIKE